MQEEKKERDLGLKRRLRRFVGPGSHRRDARSKKSQSMGRASQPDGQSQPLGKQTNALASERTALGKAPRGDRARVPGG